ncbi:hypothetical protein WN093_12070 [Gammaproteobacteria bacterium AS21]
MDQNNTSKDGLGLFIDLDDITKELTEHIQGLDSKVNKAVKRALKKVGTWLRTHSMREIGKELQINLSALRKRYRLSTTNKNHNNELKLWVGLLSIAAHDAGKALKNKAGTKVRGHQFDSAFKAKIYNNEERVFIRSAANKKQQHTTVGSKGKKKRSRHKQDLPASISSRFPVEVVGIDVQEIGLDVLERYEKRINKRYGELLTQELHFALNVEN